MKDQYSPEVLVGLTTDPLFGYWTRQPVNRKSLRDKFTAIRSKTWPSVSTREGSPPAPLVVKARTVLEKLSNRAADSSKPAWEPWDSNTWTRLCAECIESINALHRSIYEPKETDAKTPPKSPPP